MSVDADLLSRADALLTGAPSLNGHDHGASSAPPRLNFRTARQFSQETAAETDWVVHGYVPVGGVLKIDGAPKRGKTTLITHIIKATLTGGDILGNPTKQGPVILLSEQGDSSLREAIERPGLSDHDDLYIATYRDIAGLAWTDVVAETFAFAEKIGAVMIVVDTFPQVSRVRGDDENSAGRALEALEPVQIGADTYGVGVIVSFHDRKGGGEVGESGRGSSAYAGAVDVIVRLSKPGGNMKPTIRKIEALSRFDATPSELFIELTDRGFVSLGSEGDVVTAMVANALIDLLPTTDDAAKPISQIKHKEKDEAGEAAERIEPGILDDLASKGIKTARSTLDTELSRWLKAGYIGRSGEGKRGSPYRFWLISTPPESFFRSDEKLSSDARTPSEETNSDDFDEEVF